MSTLVYSIDKLGIDTVFRLRDVYNSVLKSINYYDVENFDPYRLASEEVTEDEAWESLACVYEEESFFFNGAYPRGRATYLDTFRMMTRIWTEGVHLNIGRDYNFKLTQIIAERRQGKNDKDKYIARCAYPGSNIAQSNFG